MESIVLLNASSTCCWGNYIISGASSTSSYLSICLDFPTTFIPEFISIWSIFCFHFSLKEEEAAVVVLIALLFDWIHNQTILYWGCRAVKWTSEQGFICNWVVLVEWNQHFSTTEELIKLWSDGGQSRVEEEEARRIMSGKGGCKWAAGERQWRIANWDWVEWNVLIIMLL